jgi:hypothetical protein
MSVRSRAGRPARRDLVLALEGLEVRALLSYAALYARADLRAASIPAHLDFAPASSSTAAASSTAQANSSSAAAAATASVGANIRIPPILKTLANIVYPPGTSPQPTNRELVRQAVSANFSGDYTSGPGRFTDQAKTINLTAFGGANFSFHTNLTGVFYTPINPTSSAVGLITLFPRNVLTSGAEFSYDLTATGSDKHGLPNEFSAVADQGESGGIPLSSGQSPGGPNRSAGIVTVHYFPETTQDGFSSGKFYLTLRALQYTSGTINPIGVPGNLPGPGALTPHRLSTLGTGR